MNKQYHDSALRQIFDTAYHAGVTEDDQDAAYENFEALMEQHSKAERQAAERAGELKLGDIVTYQGKQYEVAGLSRVVYDADCEGEPEWKHTKQLQEVAIVEPFSRHQVFVKPAWVSVAELQALTTPTAEQPRFKVGDKVVVTSGGFKDGVPTLGLVVKTLPETHLYQVEFEDASYWFDEARLQPDASVDAVMGKIAESHSRIRQPENAKTKQWVESKKPHSRDSFMGESYDEQPERKWRCDNCGSDQHSTDDCWGQPEEGKGA